MADENIKYKDDDYIEIKIPGSGESASAESTPASEEKPSGATAPEEKPKTPAPETKKVVKKVKKTKKVAKKAPKPAPKPARNDDTSYSWVWVLLIVFGILIIAAVAMLLLRDDSGSSTGSDVESGSDTQIAALVNGKPIYESDVNSIYDRLPEQVRSTTTKEMLLDQLIDQELLVQEADKEGLSVSDEELTAYTEDIKSYFGLSEEQLNQALETQGVPREEFDYNNRRQLLVTKLLNKTVFNNIVITDEMVEEYYNENKELFAVPELVTVRHILISPEGNESLEEVQARAQEVADMIDSNFSNFCDLVTEYTVDTGSAASCGEYQVAQNGQFVPEFEEAAFDMDVNEVRLVESTFGVHIMWKVSTSEAGYQTLEEARPQIEPLLEQQAQNDAMIQYTADLRDAATLEIYPVGDVEETMPTEPMTPEEEEQVDDIVDVVVEEPQEQETSTPAEEEVVAEEETMTPDEETEPVMQTGSFGECLSSVGAVLYGVDWSPDTADQIEMLGDVFDDITYVDCDVADCSNLGEYPAYPTWMIGEDIIVGKQTLNALSSQTGCALS